MARLTQDEWIEMRREWEGSPRQGLTWLIKAGGGRWDITEEAVRRKRLAEEWTKPVNMGEVVRKARLAADAATPTDHGKPAGADALEREGEDGAVAAGLVVGGAPAKKAAGEESAEDIAVDLRTRLIEMHRSEWRVARGLVFKAIKAAEEAKGFDIAKFAKITTEIFHNIQIGERRAWGLDADMLDLGAMSDEQLAAVAAGKQPK